MKIKIVQIEATQEDLKASNSLRDTIALAMKRIFGSVAEPEGEDEDDRASRPLEGQIELEGLDKERKMDEVTE